MKKLLGYLPSLSSVRRGIFLMILGMLMLSGGGFAVQASSESEPIWVMLLEIDDWICWLLVWVGFDGAVSEGRITKFVLNRTFEPLLKEIVKNVRGEKLSTQESEDVED